MKGGGTEYDCVSEEGGYVRMGKEYRSRCMLMLTEDLAAEREGVASQH